MLWVENTRLIIYLPSFPSCAQERCASDGMEMRTVRPRVDSADRHRTQALPQV